jgi:hypothetical protein
MDLRIDDRHREPPLCHADLVITGWNWPSTIVNGAELRDVEAEQLGASLLDGASGQDRRSVRAGAGLADLDPAPAGVRKVIDGHFIKDSKQAQGYPPPLRRLLAYLN